MKIVSHRNSEGVWYRDKKSSRAHCEKVRKITSIIHEAENQTSEEDESMALSAKAKDWLQQHGLEGFIRVAKAPPHQEPETVARTIDVNGISPSKPPLNFQSGYYRLWKPRLQKYCMNISVLTHWQARHIELMGPKIGCFGKSPKYSSNTGLYTLDHRPYRKTESGSSSPPMKDYG